MDANTKFIDTLVVGGGLSGLVVAAELRRAGVEFRLFEDSSLGGRLNEWGGWCLAPTPDNFAEAARWGHPWARDFSTLTEDLAAAAALLRVGAPSGVDPALARAAHECGWQVRGKQFARSRTAARPFHPRELFVADDPLTFHLSRRVGTFSVERDGTKHVRVVDPATGRAEPWRARKLVLAGGPERTRALVAGASFDDPHGIRERVGQGASTHLALGYALALPPEADRDLMSVGDATRGAVIERFVNLPGDPARDYRGGFLLEVRGAYRARDLRERVEVELPESMDAEDVYLIFGLGEALPRTLGARWAWNDEDRRMAADLESAAMRLGETLAVTEGELFPLQAGLDTTAGLHEAGGCPEGVDPATAVTQPTGELHGVPGVYVAGAARWPTALDRYPSWLLAADALALARRLRGT